MYDRSIADVKYNNSKKGRITNRVASARHSRKLKLRILNTLGGKCTRCGDLDIRVLQIDHIFGGGKLEIESYKGDLRVYYRHILEDIDSKKYQILCANCNTIKKLEGYTYRGRAYVRRLRSQIINKLGRRCIICGNTNPIVLQIDHTYGGGEQERKSLHFNVYAYYKRILEEIGSSKYQLLCVNCNVIKRHENHEYGDEFSENRNCTSN